MKSFIAFLGCLIFLVFSYSVEIGFTGETVDHPSVPSSYLYFNYLPAELGGETSIETKNKMAFSLPAKNIARARVRDFFFGNSLFNTTWTTFPGSVKTLDGLGPLFNRSSCSGCHLRDGRGRPALKDETKLLSILFKTARLKNKTQLVPDPFYGEQLQSQAIAGVTPEGGVETLWKLTQGYFKDGEEYQLRYPLYRLQDPKNNHREGVLISARVAPAVIGLGLLAAIDEEDILTSVDPDDENQDGISGRSVYAIDDGEKKRIGRFGWKANVPSIRQQIAIAAINDMGLSNPFFPRECLERQLDCDSSLKGEELDLSKLQLDKLTTYASLLAVPKRRRVMDPQVKNGERLFFKIECNRCHRASYTTSDDPGHLPELRKQVIYPFTDLLLHDLGEGLDEYGRRTETYRENRFSNRISSREWRTPPLWGIGLIPVVNHHSFYLHDGRARNLEEAILWHGGEGESSRNRYLGLSRLERNSLIDFLKSL